MIVDGRAISGLAVPYDTVAARNGRRYQFPRGSIVWGDPTRVRLRSQHDPATVVGKAVQLTDTERGLYARLSVPSGEAGDRALALAGLWRGLSIGLADNAEWDLRGDIYHCVHAVLVEISLTPTPAFAQAVA